MTTTAFQPILDAIAVAPESSDVTLLKALVEAMRPETGESPAMSQQRFAELLLLLQAHPDLAEALGAYFSSVLAARRHRFLYAESGILENTGFFTEFSRRIGERLLPPALDDRFLRDLLDDVFDRGNDVRWLKTISVEQWQAFLALLKWNNSTPGLQHARREIAEALRTLGYRLAALGLEPDLVRYYAPLVQYESPFIALQLELEALTERMLQPPEGAELEAVDGAHVEVLIAQCESALDRIRKQAHESGVTIRLTWHLMRAQQILERMRELLVLVDERLAGEASGADRNRSAITFAGRMLRSVQRHNSVRELFGKATDLLARQVTEHASKTGEHYVTSNRSEFFQMFRAAAGAGVVVAFMALFKFQLLKLSLAPLWEAVVYSLFYGTGFVIIHLFGFTLATKQPAMTAATLAAALDPKHGGKGPLAEMTELIVQVSRSQWIAILGNILLGFSTALAVALLWQWGSGHTYIDATKGAQTLQGLHPFTSAALLYAAIAGVFLFLSGLLSGYYDNKAIYQHFPERIRRVRLLQWLGPRRLDALANYLEHNLGALVGNFAFGCMLGCITPFGDILGVPLAIQHVTFASANFAYSLSALSYSVIWHNILACSAGVLLIGMVNLGVSFSLAMRVALKSRGIKVSNKRALLRSLWQRFIQQPRDFFWPPKEETSKEEASKEEMPGGGEEKTGGPAHAKDR